MLVCSLLLPGVGLHPAFQDAFGVVVALTFSGLKFINFKFVNIIFA